MIETSRQTRLVRTFAILADTLVADYDVVELLQTLVDSCRDLLDVTHAAILLGNSAGELELMASTREATQLVEMLQLSATVGPCIECYQTGQRVSVPDFTEAPTAWAELRRSALHGGFGAVDVIPMRLRHETIGALMLLRAGTGAAPEDDLAAAQAFADVATIGISHERAVSDSKTLACELQQALDSRVVIEQSKGAVSYTAGVPVDQAFQLIRTYARTRGLRLSDVAAQIVNRELRIGPGARP